ncbi:excalibur calcium-binding domain-containing protein [Nonomuraea sp. NPDC047897]|uniref:excalibur calcium-binding domain-containing protein n=1 Tax=Nonomuraea sp. NPDC047897 TaxID=3364346 RepID=UPI00371ED518
MDKPEEQPPGPPGKPQASRLTTIVLIVSLVLVVVVAGVLGTVAVLMTRSPDTPLLGAAPPQRLPTAVHFAPVRETLPAPCPGAEAVLDEQQSTCYLLEDGVTVGAVQRIEPVREKDGTYSVRIAIAPAFKEKVVRLIDEMVQEQRQLAVVLVPKTVIATPVVTQSMDGDSLSIAGFTRQDAETLVARLLGSAAGTGQPTGDPAPTGPATGDPGTGLPGTGLPGTGAPDPLNPTGAPNPLDPTGQPGTGQPGTGQPGTGQPGTPGGTTPVSGGPGSTTGGDPRYASCKEAVAAGRGPYTRGRHPEYAWYQDLDGNGVACNTADLR